MNKRKYEIAREIYSKRIRSEYVNDKTVPHFQSTARDAIELAEIFLTEFDKHERKKDEAKSE